MSQLTIGNVLPVLARHISTALALQITDPQHPDYGGIVHPDWGLAAAGNATSFITGCVFLYLAHISRQHRTLDLDPSELFAKASLATEYLLRVQRPSGLTDLRDCNYDSGPDTGFSVQMLCTLIELGRPMARLNPNRAALLGQVERFIRRAVPGICTGGFDLHYQTLDGLDHVVAQIALDFAPGGIWETDDACFRPQAGQVVFLKQSYGSMRYGSDVIQVGPGADAHRIWAMRDAEPAPHHARVLMTFVAPIDHRFSIRVWHGLAP